MTVKKFITSISKFLVQVWGAQRNVMENDKGQVRTKKYQHEELKKTAHSVKKSYQAGHFEWSLASHALPSKKKLCNKITLFLLKFHINYL